MERLKRKTEEKPKWRKLGRGSLRINRKIIKPGQVFEAWEHEIPLSFRDCVEQVGDEKLQPSAPVKPLEKQREEEGMKLDAEVIGEPVTHVTPEYNVMAKGGGWYNVISTANGKVMNERALRKDEADKLVEALK